MAEPQRTPSILEQACDVVEAYEAANPTMITYSGEARDGVVLQKGFYSMEVSPGKVLPIDG